MLAIRFRQDSPRALDRQVPLLPRVVVPACHGIAPKAGRLHSPREEGVRCTRYERVVTVRRSPWNRFASGERSASQAQHPSRGRERKEGRTDTMDACEPGLTRGAKCLGEARSTCTSPPTQSECCWSGERRPERHRIVTRAMIVLMGTDGLENMEIDHRPSPPVQIATKWPKRFYCEGVPGLDERPRAGR